MGKILFIGGPGTISGPAIRQLLADGHTVSVFTHPRTRDDCGVLSRCTVTEGDRMEFSKLTQAIRAFKPDTIVDNCAFHPDHILPVLPVIDQNCAQYIFISTCDVYGYPLSRLPMREQDPWMAPNCDYAANKVLCEKAVQENIRHAAFTILRPAYSMGPRFMLTALSRGGGLYLIPRLRKGMPVISPDDGKHLIHAGNAADTGRMLARTVLSPRAMNSCYTIGAPHAITYDAYITRIAAVVGAAPHLLHVPVDTMYALARQEIEKENLLEDLTRHDVSFSMESFLRDFPDFTWNHPMEEAAAAFIRLHDARGLLNDPGNPAEDLILSALKQGKCCQ